VLLLKEVHYRACSLLHIWQLYCVKLVLLHSALHAGSALAKAVAAFVSHARAVLVVSRLPSCVSADLVLRCTEGYLDFSMQICRCRCNTWMLASRLVSRQYCYLGIPVIPTLKRPVVGAAAALAMGRSQLLYTGTTCQHHCPHTSSTANTTSEADQAPRQPVLIDQSVIGCYTEHRPFGEPTKGSLGTAEQLRTETKMTYFHEPSFPSVRL
jgi:hypothetical protein